METVQLRVSASATGYSSIHSDSPIAGHQQQPSCSPSCWQRVYCLLLLLGTCSMGLAFAWSQWSGGKQMYSEIASDISQSHEKAVNSLLLIFLPVAFLTLVAAGFGTSSRLMPDFAATPKWGFDLQRTSINCGILSSATAVYWMLQLVYLLSAYVTNSDQQQHAQYGLLAETSKSFGRLSLLNLGMFLVPLSRHNPLLKAFNTPVEHAMQAHRICGRMSIISALIHGMLYVL